MAELKRRIAMLAVERAESSLQGRLSNSEQDRLIERSVAQLGGH
jgi:F-type H+-transporting ATPase subunit b